MRATTRIRYIAGSKKREKNRRKNRPKSMSETQARSPKVCFLPDSPLVYGKRRDSRLVFIVRSPPWMQGPPDAGCLRGNERIVWIARLPYCCWWGRAFGRPMQLKEIGMATTGFERPARTLFAAVSLAAMIAAFAIGQARAQTVNPVPPPPPPTFNPSTPNTVPQAPYVPVSPTAPSGLSGSAPVSPAIAPPPALPAIAPPPASPAIAPPPAVTPQTANAPAAAKPGLSRKHGGHHGGVRHRWSKRHARLHAVRALGPSYYPGLGEFYPPYANPCHFSRVWSGYYAGLWSTYGCSW